MVWSVCLLSSWKTADAGHEVKEYISGFSCKCVCDVMCCVLLLCWFRIVASPSSAAACMCHTVVA